MRWAVLCLLAFAATAAWSQTIRLRRLPAYTVVSPSGSYSLYVEPVDRGLRAADVALRHRGGEVWSRRVSGYWADAAVGDTGVVAASSDDRKRSEIVFQLYAPDGGLLAEYREGPIEQHPMHGPFWPAGLGVFIDDVRGVAVWRVCRRDDNPLSESWMRYRLSDGAPAGSVSVGAGTGSVFSVTPVPATDRLLVERRSTSKPTSISFELTDGEAKPSWSISFANEIDDWMSALGRLETVVPDTYSSSVLGTPAPAQFELYGIRARQRIRYEVGPDGSAQEKGRVPYDRMLWPKNGPMPARTLTVTRRVTIGLRPIPPGWMSSHSSFAIAGSDRIVVAEPNQTVVSVCVVDRGGKITRRVPLPVSADEAVGGIVGPALATPDRCVVVTKGDPVGGNPAALLVDLTRGQARRLLELGAGEVGAVAAYPDGSFVLLRQESSGWKTKSVLELHGPKGDRRWNRALSDGARPEDIAIDKRGRIAVLQRSPMRLRRFDRAGTELPGFQFPIDTIGQFDKPARLRILPSGGLAVQAFAVHRFAPDGKPAGAVILKQSEFDISLANDIQIDGEGHYWLSNGSVIVEFDPAGKPLDVVGREIHRATPTAVGDLVVTPAGQVFVADRDTGVVFRIDADGLPVPFGLPVGWDFPAVGTQPVLIAANSGDLFVWALSRGQYLHFAPNGVRVGWIAPAEGKLYVPRIYRDDWPWIGHMLVSSGGVIARQSKLLPNGAWDDGPSAASADGSTVSFEPHSYGRVRAMRDSRIGIAFRGPDGTPQGMARLSHQIDYVRSAAFDGNVTYVADGKGIRAIDRDGKSVSLTLPGVDRMGWGWRCYCADGQLVLFDGVQTLYFCVPPVETR